MTSNQRIKVGCLVAGAMMMTACGSGTTVPPPVEPGQVAGQSEVTPVAGSFEDEVAFLEAHGSKVIVLESKEGGRIAVSPTYQARVMTSAVAPRGKSLGWIFRKFIEEGRSGTQFDNYGGEDRFWLGPEGGQFGLYFGKGKPFAFDQWQTPSTFQAGEWPVMDARKDSLAFERSMRVANHSGTQFDLKVNRTINMLGRAEAEGKLGVAIPPGVSWVGFESTNRVTNAGDAPWTEEGGLLSIWILGMYQPTADTHVVIPFAKDAEGPIVNDDYFGKVPENRLLVRREQGYLLFRCDGEYRSKIGLGPSRARPVLGSYSPSGQLLTLVQFDKPEGAAKYVNSMWEHQAKPYAGDVVNSYNDGPTEPGKPALGGFYEMETSSPAAALAPGASIEHVHRTYHFVGPQEQLEGIARAVLGVSLSDVAKGI